MTLKLKASYIFIFSLLITLCFNTWEMANTANYNNTPVSIIYTFMLLPIITGGILVFIIKPSNIKYVSEFYSGFVLLVVLLAVSFVQIFKVGNFTFSTIGQAFRIFVPFCYAFFAINLLSKHDIEFIMKISLVLAWIAYIVGQSFSEINLQSIFSMSFVNSYSPFENSPVAGIAFALAVYFIFNYRSHLMYCFFSILLSFLCFKRVYLIGMFLCIMYTLFIKNKDKFDSKVNYPLIIVSTIFFLLATKFYLFTMEPQNLMWDYQRLNFDVNQFSMGRSYRVAFLFDHNFVSYGLGSTTKFLNNTFVANAANYTSSILELDLIEILLEVGIIPLTLLIFVYYSLTKNSMYSYIIITIMLLNLLMATGLTDYVEWTIVLITLALIRFTKTDNLNIKD